MAVHQRKLALGALCVLAFEFVAFSDFDGAGASDLYLLQVGAGTPKAAPPNVAFLFDSSGSMNNLICEDLGDSGCGTDSLSAKNAANASTVCASDVLDGVDGPNTDGLGAVSAYEPPYRPADGTTFQGDRYPIFDPRLAGTADDHFPTGSLYAHGWNEPWEQLALGTGFTAKEKIDAAIAAICDPMVDCWLKSRCIFSLRTQGYFWEPSDSTCGTGDPMNLGCAAGGSPPPDPPDPPDSPDSPGAWEGPPVPTCECTSSPCTDENCERPTTATCGIWPPLPIPARCVSASVDSSATVGEPFYIGCHATVFTQVRMGIWNFVDDGAAIKAKGRFGNNNYIGKNVETKNGAVFGSNNFFGDNSVLKAQDVIGNHVCIGANTELKAKATIGDNVRIGANVVIHNGVIVGAGATVADGAILTPGTVVPPGGLVGGGGSEEKSQLPIFLGDYLNFYPPKGIGLIRAFAATLAALDGDARIAISDLSDRDGKVAYPLQPSCADVGDSCLDSDGYTQCFDPTDADLVAYLYETLRFADETPLAKRLDNIGDYLATSAGVTPLCDYPSEVCGSGSSYVVMITDGFPTADATLASQVPYTNGQVMGFTDGYYQSDHQFIDDVAAAFESTDVDFRADLPDRQNAATYAISYGLVDAADASQCVGLLRTVATAGSGNCYPAHNVGELQGALQSIVAEMVLRAEGFTAPGVPTTRFTGEATVQNAMFRPNLDFPLWEGHLFSFDLCDERLESCECGGTSSTELCVKAQGDKPVTFDARGNLEPLPNWDAQLCLSGRQVSPPAAIANDYRQLDVSGCYLDPSRRTIFTAVEQSSPANTSLLADDQLAFAASNLTAVPQLLAELDVGDDLARGTKLVEFFRGADSFDTDHDGDGAESRNLNTMRNADGELVDGWWVLGDIFHSIPNIVERPTGKGLGAWGASESYQKFSLDNASRDKAILAGANDGMLHAFHAGKWQSAAEAYDGGTGKELWAYVTPESLARLKNVCDPSVGCTFASHEYFVDGSVMVRDIWTGGSQALPVTDKDDPSNSIYWKTIAVVGHRRGGKTYVAIDITDIGHPTLLWVFPQQGSQDNFGHPVSALMGESWLDVFPAPAAIGPLPWDSDNNPASPQFYDRWVVLLSGGYDPLDSKGRALFVVDALTGDILGMWQKASTGVLADMNYSFPATPAFYPDLRAPNPYIAGVVAADHGGQIWHLTTHPATTVNGRINNFEVELVFRSTNPPIKTDAVGGNSDGVLDADEYQARPFFFGPTLTAHNGGVRAILASGDRHRLIPHPGAFPDAVNAALCGVDGTGAETDAFIQRLYAIDIAPCRNDSTTPPSPVACTEDDLKEIDDSDPSLGYAVAGSRGWYVKLAPGEKSSAPYDIFNGFALYTTFTPSTPCSDSQTACTPAMPGNGTLHARHYIAGTVFDWNGDGKALPSDEASVDLGSGVPSAPALSVSVSATETAPSILPTKPGDQALSMGALEGSTIDEVMRFPVTRLVHEKLH